MPIIIRDNGSGKGIAVNPINMVTDGLVLYLDAANPKSYPKTGTLWKDLTRNGNNGTLTNGPTFNTDNGGSIVFDGTDDYVQYGALSGVTSNWTVSVWFYPTSVVNYKNVIDCNFGYSSTIGNLGPRLEMNTSGTLDWIWSGDTTNNNNYYKNTVTTGFISPLQANMWYNAVITRNSNNASTSYLNGILKSNSSIIVGSSPSATFINAFNNVVIGKGFGAFNQTDRNMIGKVPLVQIYNRVLSTIEIEQNFNSTRGRFGI